MTPERQKKIDKIHKIADWSVKGLFLVVLIALFLKPANWVWWLIGILLGLALLIYSISDHWATDEDTEEFKHAVRDAIIEAQAEKKPKTKTVYNGISPLSKNLSDGHISVIHKFICDIQDQGDHIKTAELKHKLHVLEDRKEIDMSDRDQVVAWVEHITNRTVETSKFWNEYDWRRSTDQEKKWHKYLEKEYKKLR